MIKLDLGRIPEPSTRNALETIQKNINENAAAAGSLALVTFSHTTAVTSEELFHNLGFVPTDIIITKQVGGTIVWDWNTATTDRIKYTTSAAIELRLLIGRL